MKMNCNRFVNNIIRLKNNFQIYSNDKVFEI